LQAIGGAADAGVEDHGASDFRRIDRRSWPLSPPRFVIKDALKVRDDGEGALIQLEDALLDVAATRAAGRGGKSRKMVS